MRTRPQDSPLRVSLALLLATIATGCSLEAASRDSNLQGRSGGTNPPGEWRDINGDASGARYSPLDQINASNFERLRVAWEWKGASAPIDSGGATLPRNLPIYANGKLITTAASTQAGVPGVERGVTEFDAQGPKRAWSDRLSGAGESVRTFVGDYKRAATTSALQFKAGSCCAKAAAAGGACTHPCCVEAAKKGQVCAACNS